MKCPVCEKEIKDDGELIIRSYIGESINYVHTKYHYQHLLNYLLEDYLEYNEFEKEIKNIQ